MKLIVYDFDGVMTDNKVTVNENGIESVTCNRGDGLGIKMIKELGIDQLILSTEINKVVAKRAEKLRIDVIHGSTNKLESLLAHCNVRDIEMKDVVFIGNDINDLEVMKACGCSLCPSDSHKSILSISGKILKSRGGEGVVREFAELLMEGLGIVS